MNNRDERAAWLLSKAALPRIEIPVAPPPMPRQFRMPGAADRPVGPRTSPPPLPRPGSASDTRFRDRTLSWFALGDTFDEQTGPVEYEAEPRLSPRRLAAVAGAVGVALALALMLV